MFSIGAIKKADNFIWFLADGMFNKIEDAIKQTDEWYNAISIHHSSEWILFIIESIPCGGVLHMSNDEQFTLYKEKSLYVIGV